MRFPWQQRSFAVSGGLLLISIGALTLLGAFSAALVGPFSPVVLVWVVPAVVAGHLLATSGWRLVEMAWSAPGLVLTPDAVVVEDHATLHQSQAIPAEAIHSVHVGPDITRWLLSSRSDDPGGQTLLGRFPQLPNLLVMLDRPIRFQAARNLIPFWHVARPPHPSRTVRAVWVAVEDPDAAYLAFTGWRSSCSWVSADTELPAPPEAA
jgi:hypothetical protein